MIFYLIHHFEDPLFLVRIIPRKYDLGEEKYNEAEFSLLRSVSKNTAEHPLLVNLLLSG
jgi:hypothetical protein